ncbi:MULTISPECIES: FecR domain-containing protein [Sphingobacterium]|uniref:FecR domain-containing protein n=1 Tax=Sphingobacterium TaxID=28453 RepID=UPI00097E87F7|nr:MULTISPECIES: FecR domain-containing protein [Sphingobacterium]UPZ36259.1 FecR domain-containing protein [Sphingobacterium sp. PCS056]WGQ15492.1 FecR domain-containing protein [Sphingobacterium faecium]SJN52275.1 putative anti-sigma factor [Sphingobacterium faecium PCAi_F2.5]
MNKELLEKYIIGETNEEENKIIQQWLGQDSRNHAEYLKMKQMWDSLPQALEAPEVDVDQAWAKFRAARANRSADRNDTRDRKTVDIGWNWWAAAAVLLMCSLGFYYFDKSNRQEQNLYSTTSVLKNTLPDGSTVTLNKNSKLAYSSTWMNAARSVKLEQGEVFFQVLKDRAHPFVIASGKSKITVLGTSFNVRRHVDATEVIVATGLVKVSYNNHEIYLHPKEMITVKDNDTTTVSVKQVPDQFYKYYVDREFIFENTSLERVVELLSKAYEQKIVIDVAADKKLLLTATFKQNTLNDILKVIADTFKSKVIIKDSIIHITR